MQIFDGLNYNQYKGQDFNIASSKYITINF